MIIKIDDYITLGSIRNATTWQKFIDKVNELLSTTTEEIIIDMRCFTVEITDPVRTYMSMLVKESRVKFKCISGAPFVTNLLTFSTIILRQGKDDILANKFVLEEIQQRIQPTKSEAKLMKENKVRQEIINQVLDERHITGFAQLTWFADEFAKFLKEGTNGRTFSELNLSNLGNTPNRITAFLEMLCKVLKERNDSKPAENRIRQFILSISGVDVSTAESIMATNILNGRDYFKTCGIELIIGDASEGIRKHINIANLMVADPEHTKIKNFINKLGVGRVVLLTQLKRHKSKDVKNIINYRRDDEVDGQFIGIIKEIRDDKVIFDTTNMAGIRPYLDTVEATSNINAQLLIRRNIIIPYAELGYSEKGYDESIGSFWHLELFDRYVAKSTDVKYLYYETITDGTDCLKKLDKAEVVVQPELIRRGLKSYNEPFNEEAFLADIKSFTKACPKMEENNAND